MVLSNKKLKRKLRAALAESLAVKESEKQANGAPANPKEHPQEPQSLKQRLDHASPHPRLSKREIRRKKQFLEHPIPSEKGIEIQMENGENALIGSDASQKEKKSDKRAKKRKRKDRPDDDVVDEGTDLMLEKTEIRVGEINEKKKNKKRNKKKESKKKKGKEKKDEEKDEKSAAIKEEAGREASMKIEESQETCIAPTKIYAGGIPYYSTEDDIRSFFASCGTITEVDCMKFPETGKFRGIAMITFKTEAAAKRALALDGADMGGLFLKIQPYKTTCDQRSSDFSPEAVDGYNRVYVGNLSWDITEDDLKKLFVDCNVSSIRFGMDKETGEFRGYAHVDFHDSSSLGIALKLDQRVVCGRPVRIRCAVAKKKAETQLHSQPSQTKADGANIGIVKKKRRTCYECGVPGHISSSCPQKKAASN